MASSPLTSQQIDEETTETVTDFIFLGSKITADGDCNHETKRCLLFGRKNMTNLDSILKSRDVTLPTKVCLYQSCGFSSSHVSMWNLNHKEGWQLKNWYFWTGWRIPSKTPWTAGRSNQSILQETNSEYSLEGLMLKLKRKCFGHLMRRVTHWKRSWCWERLKAGGEAENRWWGGWMALLTQWTWIWASSGRCWRTGKPGEVRGVAKSQTWLNWTITSR